MRTVTEGTRTTTFAYDADGFMTSEAFPSAATVDTFVPDGADRLMSSTAKTGSTTLAGFTYGRDNADQIASVTSTGVPADNHGYSYTQLNQLKNLDGSAYGYSPADNLTLLASGGMQGFDTANQLQSATRGLAITNFGYDGRGNRTSRTPMVGTATSYRYDQANRMVSADTTTFDDDLSVGLYHSAAARSDGSAWAWGYNAYGELGNNSTTNSAVPVQVSGLSGVVAVAAGAYQTTALRADGTVWAWGSNGYGQLGNNSTVDSPVPVQVQGLSGVVAIAAGASHTLALRDDGTVWAWGFNANGQLGNASTVNALLPVQVQGLSGVSAVSGGYASSYALKADGTVWSWGYNGFGQLGNNTNADATTPVSVSGLSGVGGLSAGWFHVLAVRADGSAWAWGYNGHGELGNNTTVNSWTPVAVTGLSSVTAVIAGSYHSMARRADASVATWGWNAYGQLGSASTTNSSAPQTVAALGGVKALAAGAYNGLALRPDGSEVAWGWNGVGAVGDGTTTDRLAPVTVSNLNRGSAPLAAYAYNGDGLRTSKTVAGATKAFSWDLAQDVPLLLGDGDRKFVYGPGGRPLEQIDAAGNVTYFHQDQLGSTRLLTNAAGAAVGTFTYDPFGNLSGRSGSVNTPLRYAGEYTDAETGFVYLRARYYDPATGQLISRDPLTAMTGAPYSYVDGNPLNWTDPLGLCTFCWKAASNVLKFTAVVAAGVALAPEAPVLATVVAIGVGGAATAIDCSDSARNRHIDFSCGFSAATTMVGAVSGGMGLAIAEGAVQEVGWLTLGVLKVVQAVANGLSFWASTQAFLPAGASTLDCDQG